MPLVTLLFFCFITFNNYDNILQRAAKFTGEISDSNLICCLEDSWQNEGYFLIKHRLFYLGNTWIPGKSPALACPSHRLGEPQWLGTDEQALQCLSSHSKKPSWPGTRVCNL